MVRLENGGSFYTLLPGLVNVAPSCGSFDDNDSE